MINKGRFVTWSLDQEPSEIRYQFYWEVRFYDSLPKRARQELRHIVDTVWAHCSGFDWIDVLEWIRENTLCQPIHA